MGETFTKKVLYNHSKFPNLRAPGAFVGSNMVVLLLIEGVYARTGTVRFSTVLLYTGVLYIDTFFMPRQPYKNPEPRDWPEFSPRWETYRGLFLFFPSK